MRNKNLCIVQARMGSTRLPNKVLMEVNGVPLLEYEINRVRLAKKIDKIVVATTTKKEDGKIEALAKKLGTDCFKGFKDDLLERYYQCSLKYPDYENIIRITGDCPLIDPVLIDKVIDFFEKNNFDYASNIEKPTFPDGMDVEVFKKNALALAAKEAKWTSEKEHLTLYIQKNKNFKKGNLASEQNWSHIRLTVDYPEDFEVISFVIKNSKLTDSYLDYISLLSKNPKIMIKNMYLKRNQGLLKSLREDKIYGKQKNFKI